MNFAILKSYFVILCLLNSLIFIGEVAGKEHEQKNPKKVVLASEEWVPYTSSTLLHGGVLLHIVKEAFKVSNYDVEFKILPTKRSVKMSRDGEVDGFAVWGGYAWIGDWAHYGSDYIYSIPYVYYQRKGKAIDWTNVEEMKGLKIGIRLGDDPNHHLRELEKKKIIEIQSAPKNLNALQMLALGRVDLVPIQSKAAEYLIKSGQLEESYANKIMENPVPERVSLYRVIFPYKKLPPKRLEELLQALNHGIYVLRKQGKIEKMLEAHDRGEYNKVQ